MIQVSEHQCPAFLLQQNSFCQYIISLIVSCFNSSFQCFIQEGPGVLRPWFETCSEGTKNSNRAATFDQNTDHLMLRLWLRVANSKSDKIINVGVPYPYGPMDCLIVPFQVMPAAKDHRCVCCSLSLMAWSQSLQASGKASSWTCMSCNLFWTSCDYQFVFARKLFSLVFARLMAGQGKMMGIRKILALLILTQMCILVCPQSSAVQ